MLQALNMLENVDLKAMGYNSTRYIHALYQAMSLAFADRDFYYGDPYFPPEEPMRGLLSKEYAEGPRTADRLRSGTIRRSSRATRTRSRAGRTRFAAVLARWGAADGGAGEGAARSRRTWPRHRRVRRGLPRRHDLDQAADEEGWVVSVTPSGGWVPAVVAGTTGIGLSQRMQSFVLDPAENPFNVLEPGKRPRVTLTPSLALKDGKP